MSAHDILLALALALPRWEIRLAACQPVAAHVRYRLSARDEQAIYTVHGDWSTSLDSAARTLLGELFLVHASGRTSDAEDAALRALSGRLP